MYTVRSEAPGCPHALEISKLTLEQAQRHVKIAEDEGHKVWMFLTNNRPNKFIG